MIVNFEFLGKEPIENVITCMNYKVDKTVFFGYNELVQSQKKNLNEFLREHCGVGQVVFHELSSSKLQSVLKQMRKEIEYELAQGNDFYFDITGGESLILVAFGILSKEYETPMHLYNIEKNELIELDEGAKKSISTDVPRQYVELDLDSLVKLRGGIINYKLHKDMKDMSDQRFAEDVDKIWNVAVSYSTYWNFFSNFVRAYTNSDESLSVSLGTGSAGGGQKDSGSDRKEPEKLNEILTALREQGIIKDLNCSNGKYSFSYKNRDVADCLCDGGSVLELHTFQREKERGHCADCRVGVHLDWDGVINNQPGVDVLNEIDVITLEGNIPTFISCKSGKMGANQALHALYELETVAQRFGGKYARKVLVTFNPLEGAYYARAKEMGIDLWVMEK